MFDFMGKRKIFFGISLVIILIGIMATLVNGLVLDIQFEGGSVMRIATEDAVYTSEEMESFIMETLGKRPSSVQRLTAGGNGGDRDSILLVKFRKTGVLTQDESEQLMEAIQDKLSLEEIDASYENVEPFIGRELRDRAIMASLIAMALIFFYVAWRFSVMSGVPAAVTALVALIHDAFVMLAFYAIFRLPINDSFIAAILTILGYSINDTIVIYDRVRENSILIRKAHNFELMNRSIHQSMARSINTVVTTLITVIVVYLFSSAYNINSLKEFTLPLVVGLLSGTYSTFFIAGPLWAVWKEASLKRMGTRRGTTRTAGKAKA